MGDESLLFTFTLGFSAGNCPCQSLLKPKANTPHTISNRPRVSHATKRLKVPRTLAAAGRTDEKSIPGFSTTVDTAACFSVFFAACLGCRQQHAGLHEYHPTNVCLLRHVRRLPLCFGGVILSTISFTGRLLLANNSAPTHYAARLTGLSPIRTVPFTHTAVGVADLECCELVEWPRKPIGVIIIRVGFGAGSGLLWLMLPLVKRTVRMVCIPPWRTVRPLQSNLLRPATFYSSSIWWVPSCSAQIARTESYDHGERVQLLTWHEAQMGTKVM